MYWDVLGCTGVYLAVLGCTAMYWVVLSCNRMYLAVLGCTGLYWRTGLAWALIGWGGHWSGGSGGPVIQVGQVVQLVRMISVDGMHSENIWFSWINHQIIKKRHACDGRTDERTNEEKVEYSAVF